MKTDIALLVLILIVLYFLVQTNLSNPESEPKEVSEQSELEVAVMESEDEPEDEPDEPDESEDESEDEPEDESEDEPEDESEDEPVEPEDEPEDERDEPVEPEPLRDYCLGSYTQTCRDPNRSGEYFRYFQPSALEFVGTTCKRLPPNLPCTIREFALRNLRAPLDLDKVFYADLSDINPDLEPGKHIMTLQFFDDDIRCQLALFEWTLGKKLTDVLDLNINGSIESKFRKAYFTMNFALLVSSDNDQAIDRVLVSIQRPQQSFNSQLPEGVDDLNLKRGDTLQFELTTSVRPVTLNLLWNDYTLPFKASDHGPLPPMLNYYARVSEVFPNMIDKKYENVIIHTSVPPFSRTNSPKFEIQIKGNIIDTDYDTIHVKASNGINFQTPVFVVDQVMPDLIEPRRYIIFKVPQRKNPKMVELLKIEETLAPPYCQLYPENSNCIILQKRSDPLALLRPTPTNQLKKTSLFKDLQCVVLEVARFKTPLCVGKDVLVDRLWDHEHDPFSKYISWKHTPDCLIPRSYDMNKIIPTQGDIAQIGTLFNVEKTSYEWAGKNWPSKNVNPLYGIWDKTWGDPEPYDHWDCCSLGVAYRQRYPNEGIGYNPSRFQASKPTDLPIYRYEYKRNQCVDMNWYDVFSSIIEDNPEIDESVLAFSPESFSETLKEQLWDEYGFRKDTWVFDPEKWQPDKKLATNAFVTYNTKIKTPFGDMYFDLFQDMVGHFIKVTPWYDRIPVASTRACWGRKKFLTRVDGGLTPNAVDSRSELDCAMNISNVLRIQEGIGLIFDARRKENINDRINNSTFVNSYSDVINAIEVQKGYGRISPSSYILVYSDRDDVGRSVRVAEFVRKQGYPNTYHLQDGWMPERPERLTWTYGTWTEHIH